MHGLLYVHASMTTATNVTPAVPPGVPSVSVASCCYARPGMFPTKLTLPRLSAPILEQSMSESFMTIPLPIKTSTSRRREPNNRNSSGRKNTTIGRQTNLRNLEGNRTLHLKCTKLEIRKVCNLERHASWEFMIPASLNFTLFEYQTSYKEQKRFFTS